MSFDKEKLKTKKSAQVPGTEFTVNTLMAPLKNEEHRGSEQDHAGAIVDQEKEAEIVHNDGSGSTSETASDHGSANGSIPGSTNGSVNGTDNESESAGGTGTNDAGADDSETGSGSDSENDSEFVDGSAGVDAFKWSIGAIMGHLQAGHRPKFEETHTKRAYWIQNDLLKILDTVAQKHGDKNRIINMGLELAFLQMEKQFKKNEGKKK